MKAVKMDFSSYLTLNTHNLLLLKTTDLTMVHVPLGSVT